MAFFDAHPWVRFVTGLITGCWIGVAIGCAVTLLLAGRRLSQLETANLLLRVKLKAREKPRRTGTTGAGPVLVVPKETAGRTSSVPVGRVANAGR